MHQLAQAIPDADVLLALEPEELGAKLLFLVRRRGEAMFHPGNYLNELFGRNDPPYPRTNQAEIELCIREAWAWLESQGLVVPASGSNGSSGWRVVSRRGKRSENEAEFASETVARQLPRDILHPSIRTKCWLAFARGEFDVAIFQAMKEVEVAVRTAGKYSESDLGTDLMRKAFNPEKGPLADKNVVMSEREALSSLFAGAIGSYKNPQSHRHVPLNDASEAIEIILLANHLLRIVESRSTA